MPSKLEQIFDAIAEALIQSDIVSPGIVEGNQKTIKNGIISLGRNNADKLILFEKDVKANSKDLLGLVSGDTLETISNEISDNWQIDIEGTGETDVTIILTDNSPPLNGAPNYDLSTILYDNDQNPINVSQFLNINKESQNIDSSLADEFLDTSIFELLGDTTTRQDRINNFFLEFQNLTGQIPEFGVENGLVSDDFSSDDYSEANDISFANDDPLTESSDKFITRLDSDNDDTENLNSNTLQSLRDTLNTYLVDIDQEFPSVEDQRPTYKNKSDGYLKFRNLNQGIIIRNTNQEFVEGLNPETEDYLTTGFTITTWVRFLDKTSEGTLFNLGNPTRTTDPMGFKLDTLISDSDERYLRLLVYDGLGTAGENPYTGVPHWYDSHVGVSGYPKILSELSSVDGLDSVDITQYTEVPTDFSEWYFICATYNPTINERGSQTAITDPIYWNNNMTDNGTGTASNVYTAASGFGNRSKVEIISRSDLLRARGYKG